MTRYQSRPYECPRYREEIDAFQWDGSESGIVALQDWVGRKRWKDPASIVVTLLRTETLETWVMVRSDPSENWGRLEPRGWVAYIVPDEHPAYLSVYGDGTFRKLYEVPDPPLSGEAEEKRDG
jgi:hypothetical protein